MKNGKLCYGILGLGIGMAHAEGAELCQDCILHSACDIDQARRDKFKEAYPHAKTYENFDEFINDDELDIVSICLPSAMHAEYAVKAMEKGKHVLIEKPVDITPERAALIEEARIRTGMKAGVVHQNRFSYNMYPTKQAIESGLLGKIYLGTFAVKWHRSQNYYDRNGGWRGTWEMDGGGSLINQAVHTVDIMLWLMGNVKSVRSTAGIVNHNIDTEDLTASIIEFESGAIATFVSTTCAYPGITTEIKVYGTNGSIESNADKMETFSIKMNDDITDEALLSLVAPIVEKGGANPDDILSYSLSEIPELDEDELSDFMIEVFGKGNRKTTPLFPNLKYGHAFVVDDMVKAVIEDRDPSVLPLEAAKSVKLVLDIYRAAGLID